MGVLVALLPIVAILVSLFTFKLSSLRAGVIAYILAVFITLLPEFQLTPFGILHSSVKGFLISFIAAYVLFFGILLFHLMNHAGTITAIASFISKATNDPIMQMLILVAGFSPLIESASGFGIAFMVVAPILIALGFNRFNAAMLGLISLLAVPWGALATGTVIGANLGDVSLQRLGTGSAVISIPVFIYLIMMAVCIAGGRKGIKAKWKEALLLSFIFSASALLCNLYISVELAGVLSSLMTAMAGFMIVKLTANPKTTASMSEPDTLKHSGDNLLKMISPYIILTVFIFISRLIPGIKEFLHSHLVVELRNYSFSLPLLYSPGFWLLITCVCTVCIFNITASTLWNSIKATLKQWIPFTIATTAFVSMAEVMAEAGMTSLLASAAGTVFGAGFIMISPLIGGLGGFLTGSNTGSNAMFINLQVETATRTGLDPNLLAYAQNASSSHTTMASPSRVLLGVTLCDIQSQENHVLKRMSFIAIGSLLLIILMLGLLVWL
ncbi:L-lactate permease [Bacillus sp. V3-13]|uniref:L-lactate permease n=1 Tax=Bacillus sp. V3-13 TaxID=2053728 RepID=UPI000C78314E|nr:L-lactate permease [Bacillus sp. V3-13]PLR75803.1 L-lactate permease [Bacillus sp. V3-13]